MLGWIQLHSYTCLLSLHGLRVGGMLYGKTKGGLKIHRVLHTRNNHSWCEWSCFWKLGYGKSTYTTYDAAPWHTSQMELPSYRCDWRKQWTRLPCSSLDPQVHMMLVNHYPSLLKTLRKHIKVISSCGRWGICKDRLQEFPYILHLLIGYCMT